MLSVQEMLLHYLAILLPLQQVIGQGEEVGDHTVEVVTVAEQVQPQLQPHAIVTLVIGKLDKCDDFLQRFKELVSFS